MFAMLIIFRCINETTQLERVFYATCDNSSKHEIENKEEIFGKTLQDKRTTEGKKYKS